MPFGFFKKNKGKGRDDDLFDPTRDRLEADELELSGEFFDDGHDAPPPPPPPAYGAPPRPAPPAYGAPPRPAPPARPAPPPPPARAPSPPRPAPRPASPDDLDLTRVNDAAPRGVAPGRPTVPPPAAPVPPTQARPAPPARRPVAPPPRPAPPPPPTGFAPEPPPAPAPAPPLDDRTMVMSGPVGGECLVAWLVVASGPGRGRDLRLPGGTARLGHDPACDVCLAGDTYISSCHAEISFRGGQYELRDLGSTNGTYVNESRVDEAVLRDGDQVRLGTTRLVFKSFNL